MKNNIHEANSHPKMIIIITETDPYGQCPNVQRS